MHISDWAGWIGTGVLLASGALAGAFGYESAYPRTGPGEVELKAIPGLSVMETQAEGKYFLGGGNPLFMRLFRYIRAHDVAMTTPVEVDPEINRMRFFVGTEDAGKALKDQDAVKVTRLPARRVVSAGLRGSYTRERFNEGLKAIRSWLEKNPAWKPAGEPYAVYWNSPFMPGFLKKSEVHQPVESASGTE